MHPTGFCAKCCPPSIQSDIILRYLILLIFAVLAGCSKPQPLPFNAKDITGATFGRDFLLNDHHGHPRRLGDYQGKVVVMFFGYTQCPDVCPTTMSAMSEVMKMLGPDADRVQVLFVTLDPERDKPEMLAQYAPTFHPSFIGLYGDKAATEAIAREFRIIYLKQPGATPDSYTLDHSAGSYVFDQKGRLRLNIRYGERPDLISQDLRRLIAGE